ncbi:MAG: hypothetical protein KAR40_18150 [Candidatus Sabulitectum sp.]|nr:hypothetical protein [Candidatus Sabulitectum sp.]
MIGLILFTCLGVTVGSGWSDPVLATDSANTSRREQLIYRDGLGRFHLVWAGFNNEPRIAYKMFALDGSTLYPETMISLDSHSSLHSMTVTGDSLIVFWRDYGPVYYAIRSLSDGSEITPATYLFSASSMYPYIRACPDNLGRLHVLYNEGSDVVYAVWNPAPGSGFTTEYEWVIKDADAGGVLLVDGNRVHIVVQDPLFHTYEYLQYDLEGNTVVPQTDFTDDDLHSSRFPVLQLDSSRNLLIFDETIAYKADEAIYMWKLNGDTGELLIDLKPLVTPELPVMNTSDYFIVEPLAVPDQYYLCWSSGYDINKIFNLVFDSDGNIIVDWHVAYDYSDEDPEDTKHIDGISDSEGNLYIIYCQVETDPQIDYFPTFGWFDYSYLAIENSSLAIQGETGFMVSQNPVTGSVTISTAISTEQELRVYDISGREVSSISVSDGIGTWYGRGFSGERLPTGIYNIVGVSGFIQRITLLGR